MDVNPIKEDTNSIIVSLYALSSSNLLSLAEGCYNIIQRWSISGKNAQQSIEGCQTVSSGALRICLGKVDTQGTAVTLELSECCYKYSKLRP